MAVAVGATGTRRVVPPLQRERTSTCWWRRRVAAHRAPTTLRKSQLRSVLRSDGSPGRVDGRSTPEHPQARHVAVEKPPLQRRAERRSGFARVSHRRPTAPQGTVRLWITSRESLVIAARLVPVRGVPPDNVELRVLRSVDPQAERQSRRRRDEVLGKRCGRAGASCGDLYRHHATINVVVTGHGSVQNKVTSG